MATGAAAGAALGPAAAHLARLGAESRRSGSAGAARGREYCAGALAELGFAINEQKFEYSEFPGAWAAPTLGVVIAVGAAALYAGQFWPPVRPFSIIGLFLALAVIAVVGTRGVLGFPFARRSGVNLEGTRGGADPVVWLVAHVDSKWQPVPMLARVTSATASIVGLLGLIPIEFHPGYPERVIGAALVIATVLASIPLMLSFVGSRNHGALDNASGAATVLAAASLLPESLAVGVVITDAEELALAGARAWARARRPGIALNCDSVDDEGPLVVMYNRSKPARLIGAIKAAAQRESEPLRVLRLLPGILTDSVALTAAGWETLTLSRGTVRTLQRIHTRRDNLDHLRGVGIDGAARVLARTAMVLATDLSNGRATGRANGEVN